MNCNTTHYRANSSSVPGDPTSVLDDVGPAAGAPDLYYVVSESGENYVVDARTGTCECPDATYRDVTCKHLRRVEMVRGERPLPTGVAPADVDDQLGQHVADAQVIATDGGAEIIEAGDEGEVLDEDSEADGRPDECECIDFHSDIDLPCWPCYHAGFETPASDEEGA